MSVALDRFQARHGFTIGTTGSGGFWAIQMIDDTTFSTFAAQNVTGTVTGVTFGAGQIIYGEIDSFTAGTGKVIAYKSAS